MCSGYKASSSFLRLVTPAPSCCRSNTHTKSHPRYVQRLRGKQQLPAPCHTCSKLLQEQHTHTHTKATQGMCSGYEASSSFLRLATPAPSCCRSNTHTQKATQGMCSGYEASSSFLRLATPAPSCCRSNTHTKSHPRYVQRLRGSNSFRRIHLPQAAAEAALKPAIHSIINPYNAYNCALRLDVSAPRCWSSADERIRLLALKRLCVTYN
jgi:hypothetical protein